MKEKKREAASRQAKTTSQAPELTPEAVTRILQLRDKVKSENGFDGRADKAVALIFSCACVPLGDGEWRVASQNSGGWYEVSVPDKLCSCPDARFNSPPGGLCKHLLACKFLELVTAS